MNAEPDDIEITATEIPPSAERALCAGLPFASAVEASNAAATADRSDRSGKLVPPRPALRSVPRRIEPPSTVSGTSALTILWFDPAVVRSLRSAPALASAFWDEPQRRRVIGGSRDAEPEPHPRDLALALGRATGRSAACIDVLASQAVGPDGVFVSPLVMLTGDLHVRFDAKKTLEATLGIAAASHGGCRPVRDAIEGARPLLSSEWTTNESLVAARQAVREAVARAHHPSVGLLDGVVDRALLERRAFRTRTILGEERLAFELSVSDATIPVDLPSSLRDSLPLFSRFAATVLAEIHPPQDALDPQHRAILVRALARRSQHAGPCAVRSAAP